MRPWNLRACVQQLSLPVDQSLARGSYPLGRLCLGLWNQRTSSICNYSFLPLPRLLANLGRRLSWWNQLLVASLLLQLLLCCTLVQIFSTSTVQVCTLGWRWDDTVWSSYQLQAYPHVSRRKHLGLPSRGKPSSLSPKLGVVILSSIPLTNLLGWPQLLVVYLTVRRWALVHWSPMCDSPQMLRQLGVRDREN